MIDFHSHVLPGIDDGAENADESITLLKMLAEQGVDTVIASPHYYPDSMTPEQFFKLRGRAAQALKNAITDQTGEVVLPRIALGAEVRYYDGISRLEAFGQFCIEGTNIMLLEMPFHRWSEHMMREIKHIAASGTVRLMLAHIERYIPYGCEKLLWDLSDRGVIMQSNASYFNGFLSGRKAIGQLSDGFIKALGSDCHNLKHRPPHMAEARAKIVKKLGEAFMENLDSLGQYLLGDNLNCL